MSLSRERDGQVFALRPGSLQRVAVGRQCAMKLRVDGRHDETDILPLIFQVSAADALGP